MVKRFVKAHAHVLRGSLGTVDLLIKACHFVAKKTMFSLSKAADLN
jgi:hypothetical protein